MNPKDIQTGTEPDIPINPEDDPRLQAIEALEVRAVDSKLRPLNPDSLRSKPRAPHTSELQAPAATPVVAPPKAVVAPTVKISTPTPQEKPLPKAPKTPAAEMAEELANSPPTKMYQFFHDQNGLRKSPIIIIASLGVVILVVAGFFIYKALQ